MQARKVSGRPHASTHTSNPFPPVTARACSAKSGAAAIVVKDDKNAIEAVKKLIRILPANNLELSGNDYYAENDADIDTEDLKSFLKKKMATYEVPVLIKKMTAFPVTQNGKVRKLELRRITEEGGL